MSDRPDIPGVIAKPPTIYSVAVVVALVLHFMMPLPISSAPVRLWIGLSMIGLGGVLVFFALGEFRNCETSEDTNVPTTTIVTRGPYRFSRNPMYMSLTLMLVGVGIAANIWWILLMVVPVLVVMHISVVVREERYLEQKFGQVYRDYKASVRRWF
jgi:protein-S-isoprenylcysteine O-methyltransferase Ste14